MPAPRQRSEAVAGPKTMYLRANGGNRTGNLGAKDKRQLDIGACTCGSAAIAGRFAPDGSVADQQILTVDAAGCDLKKYVMWPRSRNRHFRRLQHLWPSKPRHQGSLHHVSQNGSSLAELLLHKLQELRVGEIGAPLPVALLE